MGAPLAHSTTIDVSALFREPIFLQSGMIPGGALPVVVAPLTVSLLRERATGQHSVRLWGPHLCQSEHKWQVQLVGRTPQHATVLRPIGLEPKYRWSPGRQQTSYRYACSCNAARQGQPTLGMFWILRYDPSIIDAHQVERLHQPSSFPARFTPRIVGWRRNWGQGYLPCLSFFWPTSSGRPCDQAAKVALSRTY